MRIVTLNMWGRSGPWEARYDVAARQLAALRPDVICLQEVDDDACLRRLAHATHLDIAIADLRISCLAILSRGRPAAELMALEPSPFEAQPRRLCAIHTGSLTIANTHLSWRANDGASREAQARAIVAHLQGPAMLCGDFNAELQAPELRPLRERFVDVLGGTPAEHRPTWDNRNPHTEPYRAEWPDLRIDLLLADPQALDRHPRREALVVLDVPDPAQGLYASDHFGVLVELAD